MVVRPNNLSDRVNQQVNQKTLIVDMNGFYQMAQRLLCQQVMVQDIRIGSVWIKFQIK